MQNKNAGSFVEKLSRISTWQWEALNKAWGPSKWCWCWGLGRGLWLCGLHIHETSTVDTERRSSKGDGEEAFRGLNFWECWSPKSQIRRISKEKECWLFWMCLGRFRWNRRNICEFDSMLIWQESLRRILDREVHRANYSRKRMHNQSFWRKFFLEKEQWCCVVDGRRLGVLFLKWEMEEFVGWWS